MGGALANEWRDLVGPQGVGQVGTTGVGGYSVLREAPSSVDLGS